MKRKLEIISGLITILFAGMIFIGYPFDIPTVIIGSWILGLGVVILIGRLPDITVKDRI